MPLSVTGPRPLCVPLEASGRGTSRTAVSNGDGSTSACTLQHCPAVLPSRLSAFAAAVTFGEPLPSNDSGIHAQIHRLMDGIYEVNR
jgi:hypothetical protein